MSDPSRRSGPLISTLGASPTSRLAICESPRVDLDTRHLVRPFHRLDEIETWRTFDVGRAVAAAASPAERNGCSARMAGDDPVVPVDEFDGPVAWRRPPRWRHDARALDDMRLDLVDLPRSVGDPIDREGDDEQWPHFARIGGGTHMLVAIVENLQIGIWRDPLRLLVRHEVADASRFAERRCAERRVDADLADRGLASAIVRVARVIAGQRRVADMAAAIQMADFVREGDLVADETTANAIVTPAAAVVNRAHDGQSACLGHDAVDDVGEVEQGRK